ncbi:MAG: metallophosphoesterase [Myxococcota bacterium]
MTRILHVSDTHTAVPTRELPLREMVNKRLLGLGHLVVRRSRKFAESDKKIRKMADFAKDTLQADAVIHTGDFTALGTEEEMRAAREAMQCFDTVRLGLTVVPGNHDIYLSDSSYDSFELEFARYLVGDLKDAPVEGPFPFVRFLDSTTAVVMVNSARPNPQPWRSSGRISDTQLKRLEELLELEEVRRRFVIVGTHYAPRLESGRPDSINHGLENADDFLGVCRRISFGALVFGHVHRCYVVSVPSLNAPLFCAGSAVHDGHEGFWCFDVGSKRASARSGFWNGNAYQLSERVTYIEPAVPSD